MHISNWKDHVKNKTHGAPETKPVPARRGACLRPARQGYAEAHYGTQTWPSTEKEALQNKNENYNAQIY